MKKERKRNNFLSNFDENERKQLKKFFASLNEAISLTKKETKLFIDDFEKAILYYHEQNVPMTEILEKLAIENLGDCYKEEPTNWYPLDNAAKIYPLSMKESWMSVFRVSCYLKEDIVKEIFQMALNFTMKRFPTFRTSIRKGFFWHYIDGIKKRFPVFVDNRLPCSYINVSNFGRPSFKALCYKKRISVEYFHILTDGYGATVFLTTLVKTYLNLLGKDIPANEIALNIEQSPSREESQDEFINRKKSKKAKSLVDSKALQTDGKLSNIKPCQILHFDMNIESIKNLSKEKGVTITELMLGFIFQVLSYSTSGEGYIKIQVPNNMRKFYPSKTIRNFSLYSVISIKRSDIGDFDSLLKEIKHQMKEKNTKEQLDDTMTYTNRLVNSIKYIPLFIKKPIANLAYGYLGDKVLTTVLSNLGNINIPDEMKKEVEKMDFVLGTGITNRVLFSLISCNNVMTLTISKATTNKSVETNLYNLLKENNIDVKVHGSEVYENRK